MQPAAEMARAEKRQQRWLEAVRQGKTEDVSRMIAEGADVLAKNNGETVLHLAVEMGHTGVVTMLLNARADVAATQNNKTRRFTPLQLAVALQAPVRACLQATRGFCRFFLRRGRTFSCEPDLEKQRSMMLCINVNVVGW